MTKNKRALDVKACRDEQSSRFDAYYQTVLVSAGLSGIFKKDEPCTFEVNEPSMRTNERVVTPDVIFQCDDNTRGIVCEIKTSLPRQDDLLLDDIKEQIEKYSNINKGWKTRSKTIEEHSVLLFIHRPDSKRVARLLQKWLRSGKIKTDKKVCVSEWQVIKPIKLGSKDMLLLSHRYGSTGCKYFDRKLKADIEIPIDSATLGYEKKKFVRADPPDLYTMTILYQYVFPSFAGDGDEITVCVDDLMKILKEYYTSWSRLEGEEGQVRRRWVVRAMDKFCETRLATKVPEKQYAYKIKWGKRMKRNITAYLMDNLCGKEDTAEKADSRQTTLTSAPVMPHDWRLE